MDNKRFGVSSSDLIYPVSISYGSLFLLLRESARMKNDYDAGPKISYNLTVLVKQSLRTLLAFHAFIVIKIF